MKVSEEKTNTYTACVRDKGFIPTEMYPQSNVFPIPIKGKSLQLNCLNVNMVPQASPPPLHFWKEVLRQEFKLINTLEKMIMSNTWNKEF